MTIDCKIRRVMNAILEQCAKYTMLLERSLGDHERLIL